MRIAHSSAIATILLVIPCCAFGQAAFDVLSVEPNGGGGAREAVQTRPDGISGRNVTLKQLLRYAYDIQDIVVKAQGRVGPEQLRLTLQKLLTDRFKLRSHREKK